MLGWMLDPEVSSNIGLRGAPSLTRTLEWIECATRPGSSSCAFAIRSCGEHVGNVVIDKIDEEARNGRLSIYLGPSASRGRGIGRAATFLALRHGFGELQLHKVWLTVHVRNVAAIKTYLAAGFQVEGVHREEFPLDGRLLSVLYMGLLSHEFNAHLAPDASKKEL